MIQLEDVCLSYGTTKVVDGVSFEVPEGQNVVLLGRSGAGKTTVLKMINRLLVPTRGRVLFRGIPIDARPVHELRRGIGYVIQQVGLFPHKTVAENIGMVPALLRWRQDEITRRVEELLRIVGLDAAGFATRYPHELSGGQAQRVGVARALAGRAEVMLLDEPFGALDPLARADLQRFFLGLRRSMQLTSVFVTHDMVEALLLGDRIVVLRGGRVVQDGTPQELMRHPANDYVAELMATPREQARFVESLLEQSAEGPPVESLP